MTIDRIGNIEPIQPEKKPGKANNAGGSSRADSISISAEAQQMAEIFRVREIAAAAPESRADRIAELRQKINDPAYLNDRVINATADRLIDALIG